MYAIRTLLLIIGYFPLSSTHCTQVALHTGLHNISTHCTQVALHTGLHNISTHCTQVALHTGLHNISMLLFHISSTVMSSIPDDYFLHTHDNCLHVFNLDVLGRTKSSSLVLLSKLQKLLYRKSCMAISTSDHKQRRVVLRAIIAVKKIWTPLPRNSDNNMP